MKIEIVQSGRVLPSTYHDGKYFVEAPPTGEYAIRLINNSSQRRLAVVTVDGKNVIDGEPGSYNGGGYVLERYGRVDIPGWHRGNAEVAKFEFTPAEGSYAAQMGDGVKNTGVIGVAIFDEKPTIHHRINQRSVRRSTKGISSDEKTSAPLNFDGDHSRGCVVMDAAYEGDANQVMGIPCCAGAAPAEAYAEDIGTGYGAKQAFHTQETTFNRASAHPNLLIELRYAVRAKLVEWGVPVRKKAPEKSPFPESEVIVPAPPGWEG